MSRYATEDCAVCGMPADRCALPMYEGEVVENDATEWAGFPACQACYDAHKSLGVRGVDIRLAAMKDALAVRERVRDHLKTIIKATTDLIDQEGLVDA